MPLEIGLTADGRWDIDTPALVQAAAQAGFAALGMRADRVDARAVEIFGRAGLHCRELLGASFRGDETATLATAERLAEAASTIGADWVLTPFRDGLNDQTAKLIQRCAAIYAEAGARMAVEFSPMGPVGSIRDGLEVVEAAGFDRAGLMIDTWHFSFGKSTWEDLERVPLERIAYIQFSDALPPESGNLMNETLNRRAMPGEGNLELDRFASTLLERGWEGLVTVEVLNRELVDIPVPEFARRAYESAVRYWS